MRKSTLLIASAMSVAVAFTTYPVSAMQHEGTKADNSEMNKQEGKGMTAEQQKENDTDREITRKVRRAIVKDKSLSITAHNVKIITRDGKVTLKGPVKSQQEKQQVEKLASQAAGGKVTNQLTVAPKKDKSAEKAKEKEKKQKEEAKEKQEKAQEEQEKAKEKQ
jgi:hyperosmotically inducible periplasmic protein